MKEYNLPRGAACLSSRRPQIGARPFTYPGTILLGPSSPGTGSCREKPFGLYGSAEIVGGEYGNPGSTLYPDASQGLVRSCHGNSLGSVHLPVNPPMLPMLAKRINELPAGQTWIFEPKWDGFRALIFRDRDEILMQSRDAKSLNRYFPELLEPLGAQLPGRCVLDGEIVIAKNDGLDFEELQLRIHPAASRVKLLSRQSPASIVFFDL